MDHGDTPSGVEMHHCRQRDSPLCQLCSAPDETLVRILTRTSVLRYSLKSKTGITSKQNKRARGFELESVTFSIITF